MKYIDEFDIDMVNQALTFNTTDMHIQGTCDLFTTKPVGADRKLYKTLNKMYNPEEEEEEGESENNNVDISTNADLNPQFVQLKKRSFSYTYSNPQSVTEMLLREKKLRSQSFHSPPPPETGNEHEINSPFGPLNQSSSMKLFGYLIAILNATYPDHDFSTVQPTHFKTLSSSDVVLKVNNFLISVGKNNGLDWIWQTINTHIDIEECLCFQFTPEESFLSDFPGLLWTNMYFMFNKKKKRVAFIYLLATGLRNESRAGTEDEEGHTQRSESQGHDLMYEDVFEEEEDVDRMDVDVI